MTHPNILLGAWIRGCWGSWRYRDVWVWCVDWGCLQNWIMIKEPVGFGTVFMGALVMAGNVSRWSSYSFLTLIQGVTVAVLVFLCFFLIYCEKYLKFVEFTQKLAFFHCQFLEVGFKDCICEVELTELLVIVDLFGGVLFFGSDFVWDQRVRFFGIDLLLDFLERLVSNRLLLGGVERVHFVMVWLNYFNFIYFIAIIWMISMFCLFFHKTKSIIDLLL